MVELLFSEDRVGDYFDCDTSFSQISRELSVGEKMVNPRLLRRRLESVCKRNDKKRR